LKQDSIQSSKIFAIKVHTLGEKTDDLRKALHANPQTKVLIERLKKNDLIKGYLLDSDSGLLLFKNCVVIPNNTDLQLDIVQQRHDAPLAGHPGQGKTLELVQRDFYWANMTQFIKDYVSSCYLCNCNKNIHHKQHGFLKPLSIPDGPWTSISMDFITQLPTSNSHDSILVVVDRFTTMGVFIKTHSTETLVDLAYLFISNIFSKHGLPSDIISDKGSLFVSSF